MPDSDDRTLCVEVSDGGPAECGRGKDIIEAGHATSTGPVAWPVTAGG